jgi:hypothetical protein
MPDRTGRAAIAGGGVAASADALFEPVRAAAAVIAAELKRKPRRERE